MILLATAHPLGGRTWAPSVACGDRRHHHADEHLYDKMTPSLSRRAYHDMRRGASVDLMNIVPQGQSA